MPPKPQPASRRAPAAHSTPPVVVDPRWLLKALALCVAAGLVFAYISLCVLFKYTQWQLVLHPTHTAAHSAQEFGLQATEERFGIDATGQPQLRGWTVTAAQPSDPWIIMLPDGDGDAADLWPRVRTFHDAGLHVLLFDYRGAGASNGRHPDQDTMIEDTNWALDYLKGRPGFGPGQVLVYGKGIGASLAVKAALDHAGVTAVILESPRGDLTDAAKREARSHVVPVSLLFHDDFALAHPLSQLGKPKMIVTYGTSVSPRAQPGIHASLLSPADETGWQRSLREFLSMYAHAA